MKAPFVTGGAIDEERRELDLARDELVVVGPRLVGRAKDERASLDPYLVGAVGGLAERDPVFQRVFDIGPELECLQHRLLVLELVLQNETEDESLSEQWAGPVELGVLDRIEDTPPDVGRVVQNRLRTKNRKVRAPFRS